MKRFFLRSSLLLILSLFSLSALADLQPGDTAPQFTLPGSLNGNDFTFDLQAALEDGPVVVYFFPSAFTHGCDIEAHTFASQMAAFEKAGASVIGVSADSIERLHAFSKDPDFCAGQFPVASDPSGKVAKAYGLSMRKAADGMQDVRGVAVTHRLFERATFVINSDGIIVKAFSTQADGTTPIEHVMQSLATVRQLSD